MPACHPGAVTLYDAIGRTYTATRQPDPRVAARIHAALGDARSVVNVGAGTGSYEPACTVVAIEPSDVMIAQRPAGSAPAVRAVAEAIPLRDGAVDAAMAVLTVHHWTDVDAGIAELRRVARHRVAIFTWTPYDAAAFWLTRDYLPEAAMMDDFVAIPLDRLAGMLSGRGALQPQGVRVEVVPVPHDCQDGFGAAFWRRPEAYLDPAVRAGMSFTAKLGEETMRPGLARLAADLESGAWRERNADLLDRDELDLGYRLVVAERQALTPAAGAR